MAKWKRKVLQLKIEGEKNRIRFLDLIKRKLNSVDLISEVRKDTVKMRIGGAPEVQRDAIKRILELKKMVDSDGNKGFRKGQD